MPRLSHRHGALAFVCLLVFTLIRSIQGQTITNHNLTQGPAPAAITIYEFCTASQQAGGEVTRYYSEVFAITSAPGHQVRARETFRDLLVKKYSYENSDIAGIVCVSPNPNSRAEAKKTMQTYLTNDAKNKNNKIVETGWTYGSAGDAGIATPASTSTAPGTAAINQPPEPQAQNGQSQAIPPAGTTVVVRMIEAADSTRDPPGRQYRAAVTQPVNSGNVAIAAGAAATVSLARTGSGWAAQLTSLNINGQVVGVTSSAASVTGAAQNAANAVRSVLGGFGQRGHAAVAAVAAGDRVILPPGTTLSFVLGAMPASAATPASSTPSPAASGGITTTHNGAVSSGQQQLNSGVGASNPASGPSGYVYFCTTSVTGDRSTQYISSIFKIDGRQIVDAVFQAFAKYVGNTYANGGDASEHGGCDVDTASKPNIVQRFEASRDRALSINGRPNAAHVVDTGWKYTP